MILHPTIVHELDIRKRARPVLESLAASLRETVHLAAALVVSAPVSRMTGQAVAAIEAELRQRAAWLESQLRGGFMDSAPGDGAT
jgi:DNA-binding IclR family transcriptional regulator